jgi:drug/metabolite transporter (DMT)-like permease
MDPRGTTLVIVSAGSFALMTILAKDTATSGAGVCTVLAARFLIAAALFGAVAAARGGRPSRLPRRPALAVLALGGGVYAVESALYFSALTHIDASIASLLLCTYPALVLVLAVLLRRDTADARRVGALALAIGGALLVLSGGAGGHLDGVGLALTLGSTFGYALYVTLADGVAVSLDPVTFGALLCTGAGLTLAVGGAVTGRLHPAELGDATVLKDVVTMATVSTVLAVSAFFAGMRRIGASRASIVAGIEPFFTVVLAAALLGETLTPMQVAGGLVVVSAVFLVRTPEARVSLAGDGAPPDPAPVAPARALALEPAC